MNLIPPQISYRTLEDYTYPCVSIVFPEAVTYKGMSTVSAGNIDGLIYHLSYGNKDANLIKFYSDGRLSWNDLPIYEQYDSSSVIYSIDASGSAEKSGVLAITRSGKNMYLVGNVVFLIKQDVAINLEFKTAITGAYDYFDYDEWKDSFTGKKTIDNYKDQLKVLYNNVKVKDCRYVPNLQSSHWTN